MSENLVRLILIVFAFVGSVLAYTVLSIFSPGNSLGDMLLGAVTVLLPAMLDSLRVTKRERDSLRPPKDEGDAS